MKGGRRLYGKGNGSYILHLFSVKTPTVDYGSRVHRGTVNGDDMNAVMFTTLQPEK